MANDCWPTIASRLLLADQHWPLLAALPVPALLPGLRVQTRCRPNPNPRCPRQLFERSSYAYVPPTLGAWDLVPELAGKNNTLCGGRQGIGAYPRQAAPKATRARMCARPAPRARPPRTAAPGVAGPRGMSHCARCWAPPAGPRCQQPAALRRAHRPPPLPARSAATMVPRAGSISHLPGSTAMAARSVPQGCALAEGNVLSPQDVDRGGVLGRTKVCPSRNAFHFPGTLAAAKPTLKVPTRAGGPVAKGAWCNGEASNDYTWGGATPGANSGGFRPRKVNSGETRAATQDLFVPAPSSNSDVTTRVDLDQAFPAHPLSQTLLPPPRAMNWQIQTPRKPYRLHRCQSKSATGEPRWHL